MSLAAENAQNLLASFINRCQTAGLSASRTVDAGAALRQLQVLSHEIPSIDEPAGQLLLNHALVHVCLQAASALKGSLAIHEITASLAALVGAPDHSSLVGAYRRALLAIGDSSAPETATGDARITNALRVMRSEHANADLRLDHVAKRVSLSKWHLNRLLVRHTGHGFLHHIREIRLSHARRLLSGTTLTIKEIAFAVGYKYVNELDRHFMAKHALTPSKYRQRSLTPVRNRFAVVASHDGQL